MKFEKKQQYSYIKERRKKEKKEGRKEGGREGGRKEGRKEGRREGRIEIEIRDIDYQAHTERQDDCLS